MIRILLTALVACVMVAPLASQQTDTKPADKPATEGKSQKKPNRLANEKSPYLRQHRFNPVAWWPWCEEAFAEAKKRGVPVFLSIGYSTCHWCHVMEKESFEDKDIAAYLNDHFVCIKLDREERPDIDAIYMRVVQLMTQRGGWPATLFLAHDKKAFFGGTYFPPQQFTSLLKNVVRVWKEKPQDLLADAENIFRRIAASESKTAAKELISAEIITQVVEFEKGKHDPVEGGFGMAPKFPRTSVYETLMRSGTAEGRKMTLFSLRKMAHGGIYDHVGGGFHRYATDARWLVPHFEKMLYDQALIALTYLEAGTLSGDAFYLDVARDTLDAVLRDFVAPEGGLYSAYDADSGGIEGSYYVWTKKELDTLFKGPERKLLDARFTITADGNWNDDHLENVTVLAARQEWPAVAKELGLGLEATMGLWQKVRQRMREVRSKRVAPSLDNKVLCGWTGLGISALARGGRMLNNSDFVAAARQAADFVLAEMRNDKGGLIRRWCEGEAAFHATLQDYSYLGCGLIDLFEATSDMRYYTAALEIAEKMLKEFKAENGALYDASDSTDLIVRLQDAYDGARPSANGMACLFLLRLHALSGDKTHLAAADGIMKVFKDAVERSPWYYPVMVRCALARNRGLHEIVIVGSDNDKLRAAMVSSANKTWLPDSVHLVMNDKDATAGSSRIALLKNRKSRDGAATAWVCRSGVCNLPANSVKELQERLMEAAAEK